MAWFNFGKKDSSSPLQDAPVETVETLRARAKRRLIGALVLVLAAVVGFPLLFDTQPRPLLTNVPIDIPDRSTAPPLPAPSSTPSSVTRPVAVPVPVPAPAPLPSSTPAPVSPARVDARTSLSQQEEIIPGSPKNDKNPSNTASTGEKPAQNATKTVANINPPAPSAADKAASEKAAAEKIAAEKAAAKAKADKAASEKAAAEKQAAEKAAAAKAQADKAKNEAEASRARALLEGKPANSGNNSAAANPAASPERYIVQFGSFADNSKAREARLKVEGAGFKTYVQVAETAQGKLIRVRVGPFATKAEADKAAAKIKALSLPAAILTL